MLSINAGPFAPAISHLLLLGALIAATWVEATWVEARLVRHTLSRKTAVFGIFILGIVTARVAFVLTYFAQYSDTPWKALDIRDGGFMAWPGVICALLGVLIIGWHRPEQRRALTFGMGIGLAIWVSGSLILDHYGPPGALHVAAKCRYCAICNGNARTSHFCSSIRPKAPGQSATICLRSKWC